VTWVERSERYFSAWAVLKAQEIRSSSKPLKKNWDKDAYNVNGKGDSPAEKVEIKVEGQNKWLTLIQNASSE